MITWLTDKTKTKKKFIDNLTIKCTNIQYNIKINKYKKKKKKKKTHTHR